jgi:creatinine amidohydrolase
MAILKTMPYMFSNLSYRDLEEIFKKGRLVLLFPLGSTDPHGPHCPLSTDAIIATESCLRAAQKLWAMEYDAYVLPPLAYTFTWAARKFLGTIRISQETDRRIITDILLCLVEQGMTKICVFNAQYQPEHISNIYAALKDVYEKTGATLAFTDITRRKRSTRLPESFQKGTHADKWEGSLILATDPFLVNRERMKKLPFVDVNLTDKLFKENLDEFKAMGMSEAYLGDPASATAREGEEIFDRLADFIVEDVEKMFAGTAELPKGGLYGSEKKS